MATIIVDMDHFGSGTERDIIATHGLACCIGVAIVGTYSRRPPHGKLPESKFLAHLADGPSFRSHWEKLKRTVQHAKDHGLRNIMGKAVVVDTATLVHDEHMRWSKQAIQSQLEQNNLIVKELGQLVGGSVEVVQHHINEEKDLRITPDKQILVTDI